MTTREGDDQSFRNGLRQTAFSGIVSESSLMQKVFALVDKVSRTNSTVLILGESGTGKELVARAIHKNSGRSGKLVPVNCGAIPEEILESELFGHEKGAFTGATNAKVGRFQLADGGTIFLDEIGEMSPKLQVKLLRVLQERVVEPVGSTRSIPIDVRVIAATHKDLREEVKAGRFREDLYYRLQVVPIELPALRQRGSDVSVLSRFFLNRYTSQIGRESLTISDDVLEAFSNYSWPGNVRELENLMERTAILADTSVIGMKDIPDYILKGGSSNSAAFRLDLESEDLPPEGIDFNTVVENFENRLIRMALEKTGGNKKAAAELLHLNRTTLVEKIKKKGLESKIEVIIEPTAAARDNVEEFDSYATVSL